MTHTNTNEKAAGATNTNRLHTDTNVLNFAIDGAIRQAPDGKAISNQMAVLALAGHAVLISKQT